MPPVRDRSAMIRGMAPVRREGAYVFATLPAAPEGAIATFAEAEGLSVILPLEAAREAGLDVSLPMACLTLTVHSALDGVGLTAAVAGALAGAGIPCNMVAAFRHDHAFIPEDRAEEALAILHALSRSEG
ncbi:ACT domain-containing protein [Roseicyclus sp.]|uniref:ACT domain-containing protein n=1 Tax=Roseicyclus sp. TaxID=1914329 RepID=UPI003F9F2EB8